MSAPSQARLRAFVRQHARLAPVPDLPRIRLHTADDVMTLLARTTAELGLADQPLPYWAFPWAGGLAVAVHVTEHPEIVAGRTVLDLATGSGLCAIAAAQAGASAVEAVDIDPLAEAAVTLNAGANGVAVTMTCADLTADPPPLVDVVLAGDVCYERAMADRIVPWLRAAAAAGAVVLLGDPGRAYLPAGIERVATYRVRTTRELESTDEREVGVYRL